MNTATEVPPAGSGPVVATSGLGRLAMVVLKHRRTVIVSWMLVMVIGGMAASRISSHLSFDFSLPGQPGYETGLTILKTFGNGGVSATPSIVVVSLPGSATVSSEAASIASAFSRIQRVEPQLRVIDLANTGDRAFVTLCVNLQ